MSLYNALPIQVNSLALGSDLQGQLDENGLKATGSNEAIPAPVTASLGQVSAVGNVALQIEETVSVGNTFTSLLTSRAFSLAKMLASVPSYIFQVSSTALIWTDTDGNFTRLNLNKGQTQLSFSKASVGIYSGANSMISSADSTHMSVGNINQELALIASYVGVTVDSPLKLLGKLYDGAMSEGSAGQVLSSTALGVQWIDASGGGSVNSVDTNSASGVTVESGVPLQLTSDATLPAGSYLVNYSVGLVFSPVSGAGMQETLMESFVTDGFLTSGRSKDETVRNIAGGTSVTYYLQSSAVVVLGSPGTTSGFVTVNWSGGLGGTVTASATLTSILVGV
jgi:hypothetical protein